MEKIKLTVECWPGDCRSFTEIIDTCAKQEGWKNLKIDAENETANFKDSDGNKRVAVMSGYTLDVYDADENGDAEGDPETVEWLEILDASSAIRATDEKGNTVFLLNFD